MMNREIKFRVWRPTIKRFRFFDISTGFNIENSDIFPSVSQFTGLKDKNGTDIYFGDILNICFTSSSGEFIHDCLYQAKQGFLGGLEFYYVKLLWESYGHNQYPMSTTLCEKYNSLDSVYSNSKDRSFLYVGDQYKDKVEPEREFPFNQESTLSFSSRYFEVVGNIHENPELLEV